MSTVLDQTLDLNGQEIHRLASLYPLPDFVKNASQLEICGDQDIPPHQFADTTRRLYPTHTAAATLISTLFFQEKKAEMNPARAGMIEDRLIKAAKYWNIDTDCKQMTEKVAEAGKYNDRDLVDADYAITFKNADGTTERHYPMRNIGEVKAACDWLMLNRDKLPFDDRRKVADKLLEKAAVYGADLSQHRYTLEKMAGVGACSGKDAAGLIRTRIRALGHTHKPNEIQVELEKLAKLCEDAPRTIQHFGMLTKVASLVDHFDRTHGLVGKYDEIIERPEDVLFAVTEKTAAELEADLIGSVLTGNYYKTADLERIPVRDLADALGEEFADAVSSAGAWVNTEKLARIVPTLPLGDAEQFDEVVSACGINKFATKSASVGRGISIGEQAAMAARHKPAQGSLWDSIG